MPSVYAFFSFLSYRFFRESTYYSLLEVGEYISKRFLSFSEFFLAVYEVRQFVLPGPFLPLNLS
jgi:hypothetical protein